jgi:hypothetical protein
MQVINFFLLVTAVLATAYVSAISAKLYAVGAVIGMVAIVLTAVTFAIARRQRRKAPAGRTLSLNFRTGSLTSYSWHLSVLSVMGGVSRPAYTRSSVVFGLAALIGVGSVLYAIIH